MNPCPASHAARSAAVLLIVALTLVPGKARAGPTTPSPDSSAADSLFLNAVAIESQAEPDSSPPPRDYIAELRAGFTPENRSYAHTKTVLRIVRPLAAIGLALLFLFSGLSAALRDVAHGLGHRRYPRLLVYVILYGVAMTLLELPLSWYDSFALEHQYRLSNQSFGGWLGDEAKALLVAIVTFGVVPILWLVYSAIAGPGKLRVAPTNMIMR